MDFITPKIVRAFVKVFFFGYLLVHMMQCSHFAYETVKSTSPITRIFIVCVTQIHNTTDFKKFCLLSPQPSLKVYL